MRAVFIGPPGSGKGTQAGLLRQRLGLEVIGTGDLLREAIAAATPLGRQVQPYLERGQLVPDETVNDLVAERLKRPDRPVNFLLDGYPRTTVQAKALDNLLKVAGTPLSTVVRFVIDEDVVVRRMLARKRGDDVEETVRHRLQVYDESSKPLLTHYRKQKLLFEVQANQPVEVLYALIACQLIAPKH